MAAYLSNSDALAIAALMLGVDAVNAASDDQLTAAAEQASDEIDSASRWQGRKYDPTQDREFPRVPGEVTPDYFPNGAGPVGWPDSSPPLTACPVVWDWDRTTNEAVVPLTVKKAVVRQMNALLTPSTDENRRMLERIRLGMVMNKTGDLQEQYQPDAGESWDVGWSLLCPQAQSLLEKYRLITGALE